MPSFEPMSTTRSCGRELEHRAGFGAEIGEIVAQQLGGAAGVGIFRREDDDRIDREPELHQLALAAIQEIGRKPRLLPRHLADRHHLVDRRHVAERQHGLERRVPADLAAFDRDACAGAGGPRDFLRKRRHSSPSDAVRSAAPRARAPNTRRASAAARHRAARAVYSRAPSASKYPGSGGSCCRRALPRFRARCRGPQSPPCAAPGRRCRSPRWCRRDRCRDARPSRASP